MHSPSTSASPLYLKRIVAHFVAVLAAFALPFAAAPDVKATDGSVTVFAAASMKGALDEAAKAFETRTGTKIIISFAASSQLARQIEAGAPADLFISADVKWMDVLDAAKAIRSETRKNLVGNSLSLVTQTPPQPSFEKITPPAIDQKLIKGTFALAEVTGVPAGRYAKAALEHLGEWEKIKARVVMADNVRAALTLVARGETDFGIVYATDAKAEPGVVVVKTYPVDSHPPIVYPMALTARAHASANAFATFLAGEEAQAIFRKHGFAPPPASVK